MQKFLVGGAVRDNLLSLPVHERDWVVVGATPEQLLKKGYRQIGKDFPVFLHPETHEEYALARTERKSGSGHRGFEVYSSPDVTLEEDLLRRDLTINAIAEDLTGKLIDPYNGQRDINKRVLRHVSPAFSEDPLRVLRVARFAARFWSLGFTIAPETLSLMSAICSSGELKLLSKERVWQECKYALDTSHPEIFFLVLRQTGALKYIAPDLDTALQDKSSLLNLAQLKHIDDTEHRYVYLVLLASQTGDHFDISVTKSINQAFACTGNLQELSTLCTKYFKQCCHAKSANAEEIYDLLDAMDSFRREQRSLNILKCTLNLQPIFQVGTMDSLSFLYQLIPKLNAIFLDQAKIEALSGKEIGEAIKKLRISAIISELHQSDKGKKH